MKEVQIVKCTKDLWYKNKKFPIKTFVNEAAAEKDGESYNIFFIKYDVEDFYYCDELMGFIAKEDCVDIKSAESHYYTYVGKELYDNGKAVLGGNSCINKKLFTEQLDDLKIKIKEPTETLKFDGNKPDFTLIPQLALLETAKVFTHGHNKYGCYNYSLGTRHTRYVAAAQRHINQWLVGEDIDTDSQIHHLAAVAANALMALDNILTSKGVDNRNPVYGKSVK